MEDDEAPKAKPGDNEAEIKAKFPPCAPYDPRFPNDNISYYCFQMYTDMHRCLQLFDTPETCNYFKMVVNSVCPIEWISNFDTMRELGTFPRELPNDKLNKQKKHE